MYLFWTWHQVFFAFCVLHFMCCLEGLCQKVTALQAGMHCVSRHVLRHEFAKGLFRYVTQLNRSAIMPTELPKKSFDAQPLP